MHKVNDVVVIAATKFQTDNVMFGELGIVSCEDDTVPGFIPHWNIDFDTIYDELRRVLGPVGLFKKEQFGMYSIASYS